MNSLFSGKGEGRRGERGEESISPEADWARSLRATGVVIRPPSFSLKGVINRVSLALFAVLMAAVDRPR